MKKFLTLLLLVGLGAGAWALREKWLPLLPVNPSGLTGATATSDRHATPQAQAQAQARATSSSGEGAANARGGGAPGGGGRGAEMGPVPVISGEAVRQDVPVFLNGLGNVQGFNTVTVRSRVDGQLDKVSFTEGQDVKAGDVLAQIDPRPFQAALDQATARRDQNAALLANAELDLQRELALMKSNAGTAQKADTQKAMVEQLKATLKADEAAIEAARVQLNYATIVSPINGRTGIRAVDAGNVVRAADPSGIVVITQLQPITVIFTLSERHLPLIQTEAAKGTLPVFALDRNNNKQVAQGTLSVIDNQIDTTTGTIRLKATFPNEDLRLWPGQYTNVRLQVSVLKDAVTVPASAVQRGPAGTYAYLISPEATAELRPVTVSRFEDGIALIEKGLTPGDKVVVDGHFRIQPGARVKSSEAKTSGGGGSGPRSKADASAEHKPAGS
jgi:multidrug efflux system membrane fusion protein